MDRARGTFGLSLVALFAAPLGGCVEDGGAVDPAPNVTDGPEDTTGSVTFRLSLPGGEAFGSVSYSLTNGVTTLSGTENARPSSQVYIAIGGVPAGDGYSISLWATSNDGTVTCAGSYGTGISDAGQDNGQPFMVAVRQSTPVVLQLICAKKKS